MTLRRIRWEHLLYGVVFALALFVRLLNLGRAPLTDFEAAWALPALHLFGEGGGAATWGSNSAYILLTGLLFTVFGSSNGMARAIPALVGAFVTLVPALMVGARFLGSSLREGQTLRLAGILLSFALAIDPGLVAASRTAGGPVLALVFGLFALVSWMRRRSVWTAFFLGLFALSGASLLFGLLSLGISLLLAWWIEKAALGNPAAAWQTEGKLSLSGLTLRITAFAFLAVILTVGTLFFRIPQGLAAMFGAVPEFLQGWRTPSAIPALRVVVTLLVYAPLAILFALAALVGVGRLRQSSGEASLASFPLLWAGVSFFLILMNPGRQTLDLVWVLVPLWAAAALELAHLLHAELPEIEGAHFVSAGHGLMLVLLFGLLWYTLATLTLAGNGAVEIRAAVLGGILTLMALISVLVVLGWTWPVARLGLALGLGIAGTLYLISAMAGVSQVRAQSAQELWTPLPAAGQQDLMLATLETLGQWSSGDRRNLQIVVTREAPSIRWALRSFSQVAFLPAPDPASQPEVVITGQDQENLALTSSYRGQDFVWWTRPAWQTSLPPNFGSWFTYRTSPLEQEKLIVWGRSDLFPSSGGEASVETQP